jgi:hypothetical protein
MEGTTERIDPESTESAMRHIRSYLDGGIDLEGFWQPIPQITDFYEDFPNEPSDRLGYFWQLVAVQAMAIARLGHMEGEPDFKIYLARWLDALGRPDGEWQEIVKRKGRPLEHNEPDWDR